MVATNVCPIDEIQLDEMIKNCSDCEKVLYYSSKRSLRRAIRNKSVCHSCARKGKKHSEESKQKMSKAQKGNNNGMYGKIHSKETKQKIGEGNKGKLRSEEQKRKISESKKGKNNPMYGKIHSKETKQKIGENNVGMKGKKHSEETKKKMRLARIIDMEKKHGQMIPNYNPTACKLIEEHGKKHGYNFQHAESGGEFYIKELGYWVDGYDQEKNVVIEIDEPKHFLNGKLKQKDVRRQREITEHLKCKFIRIRI